MREHIALKHSRVMALFPQTYQSVCVRTDITKYNLGHIAKHITRDAFYNHYIPWTPQKHKKVSMRHFTMGMICTTQHKQSIILEKERQTWKHV